MTASAPTRPPNEWDQTIAQEVSRAGDWDLLFDQLEKAGCQLGVDLRLRALGLLGRLAAAGANLKDPHVLKAYLTPIFASRSERVEEVVNLITEWAKPTLETGHGSAVRRIEIDAISTIVRTDRRAIPWIVVSLSVLIIASLVAAAEWLHWVSWGLSPSASPPPIPLPSDLPTIAGWHVLAENLLARAVFALPVLFIGTLIALWRAAAGNRLVRRVGSTDWSEEFSFATEETQWFPQLTSRKPFEGLKQKLFRISDRVDVPASIHGTLRAGLAPIIEYRSTEERSAYVILADRRSADDICGLLARSVGESLAAAKIPFSQYDFRARPAVCVPARHDPDAPEQTVPLNIVAKKHSGERLIIISDGEDLFERPGWRRLPNRERRFVPPGTPVPEMRNVRDFGHAVLLTPAPRSSWGMREGMLRDLGFLVVAADLEGIAQIGRYIAQGAEEPVEPDTSEHPDDRFIRQLSAEELRYSSDLPPPPEEIANLVTDLRIWMVGSGAADPLTPARSFLVLCGLAAFPVITLGLTLVIATQLSRGEDGEEKAPVDFNVFSPLARLPWLRNGRMPDWLRIALLSSLDPQEFHLIRALQRAVLGAAMPVAASSNPPDLGRVAAGFAVALAKTEDELDLDASHVGAGEPGEQVERVFLSVWRGERLDPVRDVVTPEAPEAMRERLARPERLRRRAWIVGVLAVTGAVAIAEPILAAWIDAGWRSFNDYLGLIGAAAGAPTLTRFVGLASTASAALCVLIWLEVALRTEMTPGRRLRLRVARLSMAIPIVLAASFLALDPGAGPMPLLFALATAIFLSIAPESRTRDAVSLYEAIPERLAADDWITTSLGAVFAALVFLGPTFLFALPLIEDAKTGFGLELSATLLAATAWGLGSRFVRSPYPGKTGKRRKSAIQPPLTWVSWIGRLFDIGFLDQFMGIRQPMNYGSISRDRC